MTRHQAEQRVAAWVPCGAVSFFGLAVQLKAEGKRESMRQMALWGVRVMRQLRGPHLTTSVGQQLPLL